jgi:pyrroline-5-carboxylate reductase
MRYNEHFHESSGLPTLIDATIAFIGAGNMASALIRGLLSHGLAADRIWASDTDPDKLNALELECGINTLSDNHQLVELADVVVLAVKPQVARQVLAELREDFLARQVLLLSVAAGITLESLQAWSHDQQAIVRCMPNTPALVLSGASGLFANHNTSESQRLLAHSIMTAVGSVTWLREEAEMDAVTALSGSGPAYFFLLMEAMQDAGVALGLAPETASALCLQTAYGAARLALNSEVDVAELRRRVTSPGGTTEAAIQQFESEQFRAIVARALEKAAARSQEMARTLGKID